MKKTDAAAVKINERKFTFSIFIVSFLVLGALFTAQMLVLGQFINYTAIPVGYMVATVAIWLAAAAALSFLTNAQIRKRYQKPMHEFAGAAHKVAGGDFSVYLAPQHRADKLDYLDAIFLDFNKMVEELGSIETLKTDFFSNVSHEIRTPLAVIQNYASMLQEESLTPGQRRDYTDTILDSTRRLSDLITNLLKLSKLEKQNITPVAQPYDVCRQLCECALLFEDRWERKSIEFVTQIEDRAVINADVSLLELVWNNLLSNAIKFTPPGGTVTMVQTATENEVTVSVADTGCGMDRATVEHIFDKFYQGDTSHATEGNGLGLALASRIVELTDGSLTVESVPGEGSTFTVRLPIGHTNEEGGSRHG
ncbi:HAMP domain-containing histidine kinase [Clostridia bacterium OttesenSCG-928-O13]|nr:HAMP domain-containing histidine kinase [Clostridia bacterium OttesenSCG-928-O13]